MQILFPLFHYKRCEHFVARNTGNFYVILLKQPFDARYVQTRPGPEFNILYSHIRHTLEAVIKIIFTKKLLNANRFFHIILLIRYLFKNFLHLNDILIITVDKIAAIRTIYVL